ncbi:MAG: O-antigen ligase family protein [Bacteroidota bacterium]|nr:O-antigen ligase family protein [Bacteroidota bacterium]
MNFLILIAACLFLYGLIFKPEYIAVLFFTITLSDINFELPGIPLNIRAIVGIALFIRTLVSANATNYPSIFSSSAIYIFLFLFYTILVTMAYDLVDASFIKTTSLTVISVFCGYHYFFKTNDYTYLKISLILSGLICFSDLVYTYAAVGKFPVQRIYMQILKIPVAVDDKGDFIEVINHGFYGLICGLCFVFLLNEFIHKRATRINLLMLPLMFLGVLMSTSRSTLLGIIGIAIYLIGRQLRSRAQSKQAVKLIILGVSVVFLSLFLFTAVKEVFNLNSEFLDSITGRLVDEPVAVFYKHMGFNYNAQALNALNWREEASANAFDAFLELKSVEQIFGIGFWGFVVRNLGRNNLPPHNGMLLLLIESGIVGLVMYTTLIIAVIRKSFLTQETLSPLVVALIFIIIYCIGQNGELTTSTTFLFVVSIIAENKYSVLDTEPKTLQLDV